MSSSATHTPPDSRDIAKAVRAVRDALGVWQRDDHAFVRFTGADVATWLQSQSTNDVLALDSGQGHHNAVLDRQGRVQASFTLHRWQDEYWLLVSRDAAPPLLQHLDDHLFIEDVTMEDNGNEVDQVILQGPETLPFLAGMLGVNHVAANQLLPAAPHGVHPIELLGFEALAFRESLTGEDGYLFVLEKGRGADLVDALRNAHTHTPPCRVSPHAAEVLRIEAGIPKFGVDLDPSTVINETPLESECVAYDKGCYLGQEVVARLKSRGSLKRALVGLSFRRNPDSPPATTSSDDPMNATPPHREGEHTREPRDGHWAQQQPSLPGAERRGNLDLRELPQALFLDNKKVGVLTSFCDSPTLEAPIALAYLDRDHRTPGETFQLEIRGQHYPATVRLLPFVESFTRAERARHLYDRALDLFQRDPDDTDPSAIPMLETAILLDPEFEDAYEVLGVILHRHARTDDAIRIMTELVRLNPDCLMAHTNLSVFYVAKGMIQEAEEEKAKAAVLEIQKLSNERAAQEAADAERERLAAEARERIGMFQEVLEIDPDDAVATFGLGKAYIQLNDFDAALPHLERAVALQQDYSAAWLDLAKCHEFLGHAADARATYERGIQVASRKGDLMPMREMERRLKALDLEHA